MRVSFCKPRKRNVFRLHTEETTPIPMLMTHLGVLEGYDKRTSSGKVPVEFDARQGVARRGHLNLVKLDSPDRSGSR